MSVVGVLFWIVVAVALVWIACRAIDLLATQLGMQARLAQLLKAVVIVVAVVTMVTWLAGFMPPPPALRFAGGQPATS